MTEFWTGLVGALVGGLFSLIGAYAAYRFAVRQDRERFERDLLTEAFELLGEAAIAVDLIGDPMAGESSERRLAEICQRLDAIAVRCILKRNQPLTLALYGQDGTTSSEWFWAFRDELRAHINPKLAKALKRGDLG